MSANVTNDATLDWLQNDYCFTSYFGFPICSQQITLVSFSLAASLVTPFLILILFLQLRSQLRGDGFMNKISGKIQLGTKIFMRIQHVSLALGAFLIASILLVVYSIDAPSYSHIDGLRFAAAFLAGVVLIALAGWIGILATTMANVRVTQAAKLDGLAFAFHIAYKSATVNGMATSGLGLFGVSIIYFLMTLGHEQDTPGLRTFYSTDVLSAFGFGVSLTALFVRLAGGIFSKGVDVGAKLVSKVEIDIPDDDPCNAAVICDNVGDNIGDTVGMGADLVESFVGAIIAAAILGSPFLPHVALPFWISPSGIVAAIIAYFFVGTKKKATQKNDLIYDLSKGNLITGFLLTGFSAIIVWKFYQNFAIGWRLFGCIIIGHICGLLISQSTEYFTSNSFWPTRSITDAAITGPATVIIQGLGVGMISTAASVLLLVITVFVCYALSSNFGVAMAAVGYISNIGTMASISSFSTVVDNAKKIATMADLDNHVLEATSALDAVGHTSSAIVKGFATGSSVLTAVALVAAFKKKTGLTVVDLNDAYVTSCLLFGAMIPYVFSALTMLSVHKTAKVAIFEVRRQFIDMEGLLDGNVESDSDRCVALSSRSAIEELILPLVYSILSPVLIGLLIGPGPLAGMLIGTISSGMVLSFMMSNAGGAWNNAQKCVEDEDICGGSGSVTHKACVTGSTVGDPFRDTIGPAINCLMKMVCTVSLTLAPIIKNRPSWQIWYYGLIPLGMILFVTLSVYFIYSRTTVDVSASIQVSGSPRRNREE